MEKLKDRLWAELEELDRKADLKIGDIEYAHMLTDTIKNIDKICLLEEEDGGYGRGSSYANRGQHVVRRHYSRDGGMEDPRRDDRGRYSREDGRSKMMEHLEMALDAASEQDREDIRRFMRKLENA